VSGSDNLGPGSRHFGVSRKDPANGSDNLGPWGRHFECARRHLGTRSLHLATISRYFAGGSRHLGAGCLGFRARGFDIGGGSRHLEAAWFDLFSRCSERNATDGQVSHSRPSLSRSGPCPCAAVFQNQPDQNRPDLVLPRQEARTRMSTGFHRMA
jgi:hypothetical protein